MELSTDEDLDREDEDGNQVGPDAETESDDEQLVMESKRPEDGEDKRVVAEIDDEVMIILKRNRNQISRTRLVSIAVVTKTYFDVGNDLPERGTVKVKMAYFDN